MKIIIICILLMLFGCNSQPNNMVEPNSQSNSNIETINKPEIQDIEEEKVFLLIEEQYYLDGILNASLYFNYDELGRLIAEDSYSGNVEYTYIGDSDKIKTKTTDWDVCEIEYDNLGRKKSEISSSEGSIYYEKNFRYHGDLLIEEYTYYPDASVSEIISYRYEDGLLKSKSVESVYYGADDTYNTNTYLEVYSYGGESDKPATIEYYHMGLFLTDIHRFHYRDGLLVKRENVGFDYETGIISYISYIEYEYDEYDNLINEKYIADGECFSEVRYVYKEFK